MNAPAITDPELLRLHRTFDAQQVAFRKHPYPLVAERRAQLTALRTQLLRYQDVLVEALDQDFGGRSATESKMLDVMSSALEIDHAIGHVRRWMRPRRRSTELLFKGNRLRLTYQPKGVVGVIATWNFPVYVSIGPLAAALAAGNRVMIKMPANMPRTTATLRAMLGEVFAEDHVAVFGQELRDPNEFSSLPFNHIVFTGSPQVGKIVMGHAAKNLTPVTLELGGKSPAIVLRDYDIGDAARRIVHGKGANSGQICVAPDYALVPRERIGEFVEAARGAVNKLYGGRIAGNADCTAIVNDHHHARLQGMLDEARANGATVIVCGDAGQGRQMPVHLVLDATPEMTVMREEIFGPILPVVAYDTHEDAIRFVQERPRPLAMYLFSHDVAERGNVLRNTHSGGVTINDWGWHVMNHDVPFGGSGNSGMGSYHGEEGFRELSQARPVFQRSRWFPTQLFHPPYGGFVQRLTLRLFAGKGDPSVRKPF
ncbi:aldehyde dehydrogenase family protein [Lysobacter fragariae]